MNLFWTSSPLSKPLSALLHLSSERVPSLGPDAPMCILDYPSPPSSFPSSTVRNPSKCYGRGSPIFFLTSGLEGSPCRRTDPVLQPTNRPTSLLGVRSPTNRRAYLLTPLLRKRERLEGRPAFTAAAAKAAVLPSNDGPRGIVDRCLRRPCPHVTWSGVRDSMKNLKCPFVLVEAMKVCRQEVDLYSLKNQLFGFTSPEITL